MTWVYVVVGVVGVAILAVILAAIAGRKRRDEQASAEGDEASRGLAAAEGDFPGDTPAAEERPASAETAVLARLFTEQRTLFAQESSAANKLLKVGDGKADASLNPADLAAAAVVGLAILNHDDALMRR